MNDELTKAEKVALAEAWRKHLLAMIKRLYGGEE